MQAKAKIQTVTTTATTTAATISNAGMVVETEITTTNRLTLIQQVAMNRNSFSRWIILCIASMVMMSCGESAVYQNSKMLSEEGWPKYKVISFDYDSKDTTGNYRILVDIRNDNNYPFQNFWLFVHTMSPDSVEYSDTLNCVLADNYGKWVGRSSGSMYHVPVEFIHSTPFKKTGTYHFDLVQGMRMDTLPGIKEIGIRIVKDNGEE